MSLYQDLNLQLIEAIQNGTLDDFIHSLNQRLATDPSDFLAWLMVARAYEAKGDVVSAANSFGRLLQMASPEYRSFHKTMGEVLAFADRTGQRDLVVRARDLFSDEVVDTYVRRRAREGPVSNNAGTKPQLRSSATVSREASSSVVAASSKRKAEGDGKAKNRAADYVNAETLIAQSRKAFNEGNLEVALTKAKRAYASGDDSTQLYHLLAQTLQRLRRFEEAIEILDEGIGRLKGEQNLALINLKAQIFSSQHEYTRASEAYEELLGGERRREARRFAYLQLARVYARQGNAEQAVVTLERALKEFPTEAVLERLLTTVSRGADSTSESSDTLDEEAVKELEVDLSDESVELISPMLRRDLVNAQYRDERVLMKGGQPDTEDADSLLRTADSSKGSEFGERYPLFLEAAKAYSELPEGSYKLEDFYRALTRYAMSRGGAYVSDFRRRVLSGQLDIELLRRLRDSATSYYLESLALQLRVEPRYALIPLTNHLRIQVACAFAEAGTEITGDLFEKNFAELFRLCLNNHDSRIVRIAYESVVACGAASGAVWNHVSLMRGGPGVLTGTLDIPEDRRRTYDQLSAITGQRFTAKSRPAEVLQKAFLARREQIQMLTTFFAQLQNISLEIANIGLLQEKWKDFPLSLGTLLETDMELHSGIEAILATLLPYQSRSQEERTAMLFVARTNIDNLLRFIEENPTYWGRVGFEPMLMRWKGAIGSIESRRLSEIQPRLVASLEPPVFQMREEKVVGAIILRNVGRGTAEGARLHVELLTHESTQVEKTQTISVDNEIQVGATTNVPLEFNESLVLNHSAQPLRIRVQVAPLFRGNELETSSQEFTLEVHSGTAVKIEDIPWNEIAIPPEHLFKGRRQLIADLAHRIRSVERNKTHILYGLTRTGKSSILRYLSKELDEMQVNVGGKTRQCISFTWDMGEAKAHTNARDMWGYLLQAQVMGKLKTWSKEGKIPSESIPPLRTTENMRFRDWDEILKHLEERSLYPIFLVDEFSYYRELVDSKRIDAAFLAAIRKFAINGMASFFFAGTYDLRRLIEDPSYGITGQFVNALEIQVSQIEREPAVELIRAMEPDLSFTDEAIEDVLELSYQVPYFIQILCKNSALYAASTGRTIIGQPELEEVVQILTGEASGVRQSGLEVMAAGTFMNNMHSPTDPIEYHALLSTIADLNRGHTNARLVTYSEIQEVWSRSGVKLFQARLAKALQELCNREVLLNKDDEGMPAYRISVDLFRRWWATEHKYLNLELDALKHEAML